MPRERSRYFPVRISSAGYDFLVRRAAEETAGNMSELARRMLKFASANMPRGWQ